MTGGGVREVEMPDPFPELGDAVAEAVLLGRVPKGRPDVAPLAAYFAAVRRDAEDMPAPVAGSELSALLSAGIAPFGSTPSPRAVAHRPSRRKKMLHVALGTVVGKIVTGTAMAAASVGGLGAAGALPAPVQDVVADVAGIVGIDLPEGHPSVPVDPETGVVGSEPETTGPSSGASASTSEPTPEPAAAAPPAPPPVAEPAPAAVAPAAPSAPAHGPGAGHDDNEDHDEDADGADDEDHDEDVDDADDEDADDGDHDDGVEDDDDGADEVDDDHDGADEVEDDDEAGAHDDGDESHAEGDD